MKHQIVGGRGQKAPYESTHARIPEPLKDIVQELANLYREKVTNYENVHDQDLIIYCLTSLNILHDVNHQEIVVNAINKFVEIQKSEYGKNSAQRGKEFNTASRSWDNFNKFKNLVESEPKLLELE